MKVCRDCKVAKPPGDFYRATRTRDGLQSYCKPCMGRRTARSQARKAKHAQRWCNQCREWLPATTVFRNKCDGCKSAELATATIATEPHRPYVDPEPPSLDVYRERIEADQQRTQDAWDRLAAQTLEALGG